jgi:hypothetical protein
LPTKFNDSVLFFLDSMAVSNFDLLIAPAHRPAYASASLLPL